MEFILRNPFRSYQNWRRRREERYIVTINKPRMRIKGKTKEAKVGPRFKYVAFRGIPYALPPVGKLRFQPPVEYPELPANERNKAWKAYTLPNPCAQITSKGELMGSEDCLYLNVYTPKKPKDIPELLPVLVYIHGGGFIIGESGDVNPEGILRENLIVVTMNYRLEIFGFLNMRSDNCRGNAGMKDQVMALTWVQNNIRAFKGDPNNVTICGQSAGGSCVNLHMISPLSKGKFHKAIVMAGGVYCPWGYGGSAKHVKQLFKNKMEQENEMRHLVVKILLDWDTEQLLDFGQNTMEEAMKLEGKRMTANFCPTTEKFPDNAFLPDRVEKLMETAEAVPTIAGITKQEGYQHFRFDPKGSIEASRGGDALKEVLRHNLRWKDPTAIDRHFAAIKAIYFPDAENTDEEEKKHQYANLVTDIYFRRFYDSFNFGNLLNDGGPSFYVYEFDYFKSRPIFPINLISGGQPAITPRAAEHSDDYHFLFLPQYLQEYYFLIPRESRMIQREIKRVKTNLCQLWGSFCKNSIPESRLDGDCDVKWLEHTEQAPHYLHIAETLSLRNRRLNEERWAALNSICQLESTIPSLAESPQTPKNELKIFELPPSSEHAESSDTSSWETAAEEVVLLETDV